ncbi:hypothetical protein FA95DRAFT_1505820 [Auriscalpium vulgare]|uniref:Uncharacterized protein n=1 Tax=Auriscalpium vulgare TaxID=40419 RepID=A0ACB8R2I7_9AGAM|nr:hypothetical protein FA95DRAFT_1505820 [Auriscalpium vulgare]
MPKRVGPFVVQERVKPVAYRLQLPDTYAIHPVYEVDAIVAWRRRARRVEYLVRWKGFGPEDDTWQSAADLRNASQILRAYRSANPAAR